MSKFSGPLGERKEGKSCRGLSFLSSRPEKEGTEKKSDCPENFLSLRKSPKRVHQSLFRLKVGVVFYYH